MQFNSVIIAGVEYDILGDFYFESIDDFLIKFDLNRSNYQSILDIFFGGNPISQVSNFNQPDSITLVSSDGLIYIANPLIRYYSELSKLGTYVLKDLSSKSCDYLSMGLENDIYSDFLNLI